MNKLIFFCLICLFAKYSMAQNVNGDWIKINATNINNSFHTNPFNGLVCGYERLIITNDKVVVTNSPIDNGQTFNVVKDDSTLSFVSRNYKYNVSNDSLFLYDNLKSTDINMQPMKYTYLRFDKIITLDNQEDTLLEVVVDTLNILKTIINNKGRIKWHETQLYTTNKKYHYNIPTFIGDQGVFTNFLQYNINYDIDLNDSLDFIYAKFHITINPKGIITSIGIDEGDNKLFNEKLYQVLTEKTNVWRNCNGKQNVKLIFPLKFYKNYEFRSNKTFDYYYEKGNQYYIKKEYDKAINMFSMAIKIDNKFVDAYYNRAIVYLELDQLDKACNDWYSIYRLGYNDSYALLIKKCNGTK